MSQINHLCQQVYDILQSAIDTYATNSDRSTPFDEYIQEHDRTIADLIEASSNAGLDLNQQSMEAPLYGCSLLAYVSQHSCLKAVQCLLSHGVDPNLPHLGNENLLPICYACTAPQITRTTIAIVDELLSHDAAFNVVFFLPLFLSHISKTPLTASHIDLLILLRSYNHTYYGNPAAGKETADQVFVAMFDRLEPSAFPYEADTLEYYLLVHILLDFFSQSPSLPLPAASNYYIALPDSFLDWTCRPAIVVHAFSHARVLPEKLFIRLLYEAQSVVQPLAVVHVRVPRLPFIIYMPNAKEILPKTIDELLQRGFVTSPDQPSTRETMNWALTDYGMPTNSHSLLATVLTHQFPYTRVTVQFIELLFKLFPTVSTPYDDSDFVQVIFGFHAHHQYQHFTLLSHMLQSGSLLTEDGQTHPQFIELAKRFMFREVSGTGVTQPFSEENLHLLATALMLNRDHDINPAIIYNSSTNLRNAPMVHPSLTGCFDPTVMVDLCNLVIKTPPTHVTPWMFHSRDFDPYFVFNPYISPETIGQVIDLHVVPFEYTVTLPLGCIYHIHHQPGDLPSELTQTFFSRMSSAFPTTTSEPHANHYNTIVRTMAWLLNERLGGWNTPPYLQTVLNALSNPSIPIISESDEMVHNSAIVDRNRVIQSLLLAAINRWKKLPLGTHINAEIVQRTTTMLCSNHLCFAPEVIQVIAEHVVSAVGISLTTPDQPSRWYDPLESYKLFIIMQSYQRSSWSFLPPQALPWALPLRLLVWFLHGRHPRAHHLLDYSIFIELLHVKTAPPSKVKDFHASYLSYFLPTRLESVTAVMPSPARPSEPLTSLRYYGGTKAVPFVEFLSSPHQLPSPVSWSVSTLITSIFNTRALPGNYISPLRQDSLTPHGSQCGNLDVFIIGVLLSLMRASLHVAQDPHGSRTLGAKPTKRSPPAQLYLNLILKRVDTQFQSHFGQGDSQGVLRAVQRSIQSSKRLSSSIPSRTKQHDNNECFATVPHASLTTRPADGHSHGEPLSPVLFLGPPQPEPSDTALPFNVPSYIFNPILADSITELSPASESGIWSLEALKIPLSPEYQYSPMLPSFLLGVFHSSVQCSKYSPGTISPSALSEYSVPSFHIQGVNYTLPQSISVASTTGIPRLLREFLQCTDADVLNYSMTGLYPWLHLYEFQHACRQAQSHTLPGSRTLPHPTWTSMQCVYQLAFMFNTYFFPLFDLDGLQQSFSVVTTQDTNPVTQSDEKSAQPENQQDDSQSLQYPPLVSFLKPSASNPALLKTMESHPIFLPLDDYILKGLDHMDNFNSPAQSLSAHMFKHVCHHQTLPEVIRHPHALEDRCPCVFDGDRFNYKIIDILLHLQQYYDGVITPTIKGRTTHLWHLLCQFWVSTRPIYIPLEQPDYILAQFFLERVKMDRQQTNSSLPSLFLLFGDEFWFYRLLNVPHTPWSLLIIQDFINNDIVSVLQSASGVGKAVEPLPIFSQFIQYQVGTIGAYVLTQRCQYHTPLCRGHTSYSTTILRILTDRSKYVIQEFLDYVHSHGVYSTAIYQHDVHSDNAPTPITNPLSPKHVPFFFPYSTIFSNFIDSISIRYSTASYECLLLLMDALGKNNLTWKHCHDLIGNRRLHRIVLIIYTQNYPRLIREALMNIFQPNSVSPLLEYNDIQSTFIDFHHLSGNALTRPQYDVLILLLSMGVVLSFGSKFGDSTIVKNPHTLFPRPALPLQHLQTVQEKPSFYGADPVLTNSSDSVTSHSAAIRALTLLPITSDLNYHRHEQSRWEMARLIIWQCWFYSELSQTSGSPHFSTNHFTKMVPGKFRFVPPRDVHPEVGSVDVSIGSGGESPIIVTVDSIRSTLLESIRATTGVPVPSPSVSSSSSHIYEAMLHRATVNDENQTSKYNVHDFLTHRVHHSGQFPYALHYMTVLEALLQIPTMFYLYLNTAADIEAFLKTRQLHLVTSLEAFIRELLLVWENDLSYSAPVSTTQAAPDAKSEQYVLLGFAGSESSCSDSSFSSRSDSEEMVLGFGLFSSSISSSVETSSNSDGGSIMSMSDFSSISTTSTQGRQSAVSASPGDTTSSFGSDDDDSDGENTAGGGDGGLNEADFYLMQLYDEHQVGDSPREDNSDQRPSNASWMDTYQDQPYAHHKHHRFCIDTNNKRLASHLQANPSIMWYILNKVCFPSVDDITALLLGIYDTDKNGNEIMLATPVDLTQLNARGDNIPMHAILRRLNVNILYLLINSYGVRKVVTHRNNYGQTIFDYMVICDTKGYAPDIVDYLVTAFREAEDDSSDCESRADVEHGDAV